MIQLFSGEFIILLNVIKYVFFAYVFSGKVAIYSPLENAAKMRSL